MKFPQGSHISQEKDVESNGKILEEYIRSTDWKYIGKAFFILWVAILFAIFTLLVVIRLAFIIF